MIPPDIRRALHALQMRAHDHDANFLLEDLTALTAALEEEFPSPGPYATNRGQTHAPGCWQWRRHHNCAVSALQRIYEAWRKGEALDETIEAAFYPFGQSGA